MTARALMWKEAVILGRCRWLFLCVPLALCTPMAANILATTPLFDLGTCFLILSIAVSCFGGELVFRTSVSERRFGGLDVLLVAIKSKTLLALGKTALPAMTGSLCTLAGLAINDLAAPFYTGKALYVGMLTPTTAAAVCFTSFMCSLLDLVLLMRSREEVPLRGNTALMFALTVFMSCLYVFGGRLHPLLPIFVSMLLAGLCLLLAAASLSRPRASLNVRPTRPDTLDLAISPLTALAAKDLAAVRSWLRLLIRYVLLVATGASRPAAQVRCPSSHGFRRLLFLRWNCSTLRLSTSSRPAHLTYCTRRLAPACGCIAASALCRLPLRSRA